MAPSSVPKPWDPAPFVPSSPLLTVILGKCHKQKRTACACRCDLSSNLLSDGVLWGTVTCESLPHVTSVFWAEAGGGEGVRRECRVTRLKLVDLKGKGARVEGWSRMALGQ